MAQAKIDENDIKTWLAYNETTGFVEPVRVDPILGAVYIFNVADAGGTYTALNNAKIDQNDVKTLLAYNETSSKVEALRCNDNGALLAIEVV